MEDLEEFYSEGVEKEGELFLEGLEKKRDIGELEKEYSKKVKEIRRIYEKSLKKDLYKEKEIMQTKKPSKPQKGEVKEFRVENLDLEDNWRDEGQVKINSFSYKIGRKIKDFIKKIAPNLLIYKYYKSKVVLKNFFKEIDGYIRNIFEKISERILRVVGYVREGFLKVLSEVKKMTDIFKRKKSKEGKGEKKENGETNKQDK
jgi:hypothetical protein